MEYYKNIPSDRFDVLGYSFKKLSEHYFLKFFVPVTSHSSHTYTHNLCIYIYKNIAVYPRNHTSGLLHPSEP